MRKIIILFLIIFILSGCSVDYNVYIGENKIKDTINIVIDSDINEFKGLDLDTFYIEDELINNDNYVLLNDKLKYDKKINVENGKSYATLSAEYDYFELSDHYNINECYDKIFVDDTDEYLYIYLNDFKCELEDSINLNVSSYYEIESSNGTKESDGSYSWKLEKDKNNSIELLLNKQKSSTNASSTTSGINIYKIIMYVLIIGIGIVLFIIKKKGSKK